MGDLLDACVELVATYNPARCTIDSHAADFISLHRVTDKEDQTFMQQVFYGCMRYKRLLKIFLSSLYFKHSGETQRADNTLYMVLGYVALLRLGEVGFPDFRALILSQEHFKMSVFLKFTFSEESLVSWLRPEWIKHYEPSFVDDQVIAKLLTFAPQVQALEQVLAGRMASEAAKKEAAAEAARALAEGRGGSHKHTTPVPFDLTQPTGRRVPPPLEEINTEFKAIAVPPSTYADEKQLKDRIEIDKKKDINRVTMKAKYADPRVQPFKLRVLDRPSHLPRIKDEVEAAREAECNFEGTRAKPVPRQRDGQGEVRLNAAAILREDNLYRKKQEYEARQLSAYEQELRDSSEFDSWQARMKGVDEEARLKEVERRRIETLLADEEAKEARLRKLNENRLLATALKAEAIANNTKRCHMDEQRRTHQRAIVMDVQSQREKPGQAAEDLVRGNHAKAQELRHDMEMLAAQAAEERRIEDARRADLMQQIRALELCPRERVRVLDPTYTPKLGLLEEMSLAELRERLLMVEQEQEEEEQLRRAKIISAKQDKETDLAQRMERLTAMRELAADQAALKRDKQTKITRDTEKQRQERLAEAQLHVHAKLEQKRAVRRKQEAKLSEELEDIRIRNSFLGADRDAVERKKWQSIEGGAQREIIDRQAEANNVQRREGAVDDKSRRQRALNLKHEREEHEVFLRDYEARCTEANFDSIVAADVLASSREALHTRLGLNISADYS